MILQCVTSYNVLKRLVFPLKYSTENTDNKIKKSQIMDFEKIKKTLINEAVSSIMGNTPITSIFSDLLLEILLTK